MTGNVVEVDGLWRGFRPAFTLTYALRNVSLEVPRGCVYGLVGANGAGKTTLIKHILGLYRAQTGTVRVFGLDPVKNTVEVLRRIGYLSEDRDLPEWMRIDELMRYTRAYYPNWDVAFGEELLETFGLDRNAKIKNLSRGTRAQAGLLVALAHRPDLLVLDEPSSGLDAVVRQDILNAIIRAVADDGRTALFSSHLLDEVERMSDYVTLIHEGHVVLEGELDAIKAHHHCVEVKFPQPQISPPELPGALSAEGAGRQWSVVCDGEFDRLREALVRQNAEILDHHQPTLQEIFVARVGRKPFVQYLETE